MGLWIAIFITLAVLGSILWIKPSPRDRFLTECRQKALAKGLKVRLLDEKLSGQLFPWIENYRQFVFYEKSLPPAAKPKSNKAIVIRLSEDIHAHEIDAIDPIKSALFEAVDRKRLPRTAEALIISVSGISLLWREYQNKEEQSLDLVSEIDDLLKECIVFNKIWA